MFLSALAVVPTLYSLWFSLIALPNSCSDHLKPAPLQAKSSPRKQGFKINPPLIASMFKGVDPMVRVNREAEEGDEKEGERDGKGGGEDAADTTATTEK